VFIIPSNMAASDNPADRPPATGAVFATTLWSVVLAAGDVGASNSRAALEKLCDTYWLPIYAFLRRKGHAPADAEDLTQGFFVSLFEHNSLATITPERGRFRSFLLASLRYFLADQRDRANALKRGGGRTPLSLDADSPEAFYARQTPGGDTPERCFERAWADALLRRAQQRLREECVKAGKQVLFDDLGPTRSEDREMSYADIAARHGFSENAARLAAFRLRQRYQKIVSDEVRQTVATPEEAEDEIRHLLRVLCG
jgi:RNA polymerase sigma-70 factor (ECF subfamily)